MTPDPTNQPCDEAAKCRRNILNGDLDTHAFAEYFHVQSEAEQQRIRDDILESCNQACVAYADRVSREDKERIVELEAQLAVASMLMREVVGAHRDPQCPEYNECETDRCAWCDKAISIVNSGQSFLTAARELREALKEAKDNLHHSYECRLVHCTCVVAEITEQADKALQSAKEAGI